ncbi:MAG TPA: membrane dipeptidase [Rhodanobacteraceae bacterium]
MTNRRAFLHAAALAALAPALPLRAAPATERWPRYRDVISIDGEGGLELLRADDVDAKMVERELAEARASGLTAALLQVTGTHAGFEEAVNDLMRCRARVAAHKDAFLIVETAADLQRAKRESKLGLILRFQGAEPIGDNFDHVAAFRALGIRVVELTHNRRNLYGDGSTEPGNAGLSVLGRVLVEQLNVDRIVVDVAHGSERTMKEGIAASKAPVVISHSGCRALSDLPRLADDDTLRAMAKSGGVIGIMFWPYLTREGQPMAIDVIRHIEHAIDVCGEDHVGIGTDGSIASIERTAEFEKQNLESMRQTVADGIFGPGRKAEGLYYFVPDLNAPNRFELLAAKLAARGHSDARIEKILGGNFARVFAEVWG